MDVLGPRIFHNRPVLGSRRRPTRGAQFSEIVLVVEITLYDPTE